MKETTKQNLLFSSIIGALLALIFVVAITIASELLPDVKTWLKNLSGHHWISKSILSMVIYAGGFLLVLPFQKNISPAGLKQVLVLLILATVLGSIALLGFYTWHYIAP